MLAELEDFFSSSLSVLADQCCILWWKMPISDHIQHQRWKSPEVLQVLSWKRSAKRNCASALLRKWHRGYVHTPGTYRLHMPVELSSCLWRTLYNSVMSGNIGSPLLFWHITDLHNIRIMVALTLLEFDNLTSGTNIVSMEKIQFVVLFQRIKLFQVVKLECCYIYNCIVGWILNIPIK